MPVSRPFVSPRLRASLQHALRLGLPLGALILMSTIFLVSRSVDPTRAVAMSSLDLAALTREPRIGSARIAGVTATDAAITIGAAAIRSVTDPQAPGPVTLAMEQPEGQLLFPNGTTVTFASVSGQIDQAQNTVILQQDVALTTSDGYQVTLNALNANLADATLLGTGPVRGQGPGGTLTADQVRITALPGTSGGYLLAFTGDVRLLYIPQ